MQRKTPKKSGVGSVSIRVQAEHEQDEEEDAGERDPLVSHRGSGAGSSYTERERRDALHVGFGSATGPAGREGAGLAWLPS